MKALMFFLLVGISSNLAAAMIVQQSIDTITNASGMVFEGTVTDKKSLKIRNNYFTDVTFEIADLLKGQHKSSTVTLRYLGGFVDGFGSGVSGVKMPELNEHGIYFVADSSKFSAHPLTGWGQGHFILKDNGLEYNVENSLGSSIVKIEDNGVLKKEVSDKRQQAIYNAFMARGLESSTVESSQGLTSDVFKDSIRNIIAK